MQNIFRVILLSCFSFSSLLYGADLTSEQALEEVVNAAQSNDATAITVDIINAIDGIDIAEEAFLEDYQAIIAEEIDPESTDIPEELLFFIEAINDTPADVGEQTLVENMTELWSDERYSYNDDGTVSDSISGLTWMICSFGQSFDGIDACTDPEDENNLLATWGEALNYAVDLNSSGGFAGFNDWRVPNVNELASIIARNRYAPALNKIAFSEILQDWYWTSTPDFSDGTKSWQVNFFDGNDFPEVRSESAHILLVRSH